MTSALSINPRFDADNGRFVDSCLFGLRGLIPFVKNAYNKRLHGVGEVRAVNEWLIETAADIESRVKLCDLNLTADDDEFQTFADAKARQCERMINGAKFPALLIEGFLEQYGIECEEMNTGRYKKGPFKGQMKPAKNWEKRVSVKKWWLGKVRKMAARVCEQVCRELGKTSKRTGVYISDYSLRKWTAAQIRNALLLEKMECENDLGQLFSVAELAELGLSNPIIRRGELMVRIRGFEEWAEADSRDWAAIFVTITCPSKFHAVHNWGGINDKYQGATPAEAQQHLNKVWSKSRAELARQGVDYFGFRVAEPHHDGCPHWHMLLFVEKNSSKKSVLQDVIRGYAMEEDSDEPGADEFRFDCKDIDPEEGSAVGYIAKYIAKNIDGFAIDQDWEADRPAMETATRVRAWASVWGIRQFQQIAGPQVSIYRELRRLANHSESVPVPTALASEGPLEQQDLELEKTMAAADQGDWAEYTRRMGGAVCKREERPLSIFRRLGIRKVKADNGKYDIAPKLGLYGDPVTEIKGLWSWFIDLPITTRFREWTTRFKSEVAAATDSKQSPPVTV